jgi:hypothetical protein
MCPLKKQKGKIIEEISFDKKGIFEIKLDGVIFIINAICCTSCMDIKIGKYLDYALNDLKDTIFIELEECEKPDGVTFQNEDFDENSENTSYDYHYYYIEYEYPISKEHYYYYFCLTCEYYHDPQRRETFEGLDSVNYTELLAKRAKRIQKNLFNTKSADNV